MIFKLEIALIFYWLHNNGALHVPHCVLKCKDAHMQQMEKEWSANFAFPLLSLLKATGNETAAHNRAIEICRSNGMLVECLAGCNKTDERTILELGLLPWRDICSNLHVLQTQFPCWRLNINNLTINCQKESYELHESMKFLSINESLPVLQKICSSLNKFAECSIRDYGYFCGHNSETLIDRLFWISRGAIKDMLKIKWPVLPAPCNINFSRRELNTLKSISVRNLKSQCKACNLLLGFIILLPYFILYTY